MNGREENYAAAGIVQHECGLFGREGSVERDGHRTEKQGGHVGGGPFRPVLAEDGHAIALADAPFTQDSRCADDVAAELLRRDGEPVTGLLAVQHGAVEIALDCGEENVVQRGDAHRGLGSVCTECTVSRAVWAT